MTSYTKFDQIPDNTYDVLYADPPWLYKTWTDKNTSYGCADAHYDLMDIDKLKTMNVARIAKKDAYLCMWATAPLIASGEALEVMKAWGFDAKTILFVWLKTHGGMKTTVGLGHYTRSSAEFVFVGKRGTPKGVVRHDIQQAIIAPLRKHSQKPNEIYTRLHLLFGDNLKYIELFARQNVPDFGDSFGNDIRLLDKPLSFFDGGSND